MGCKALMRCRMQCSRCIVCGALMCIMTSHDAVLRIWGAHKCVTKTRNVAHMDICDVL